MPYAIEIFLNSSNNTYISIFYLSHKLLLTLLYVGSYKYSPNCTYLKLKRQNKSTIYIESWNKLIE